MRGQITTFIILGMLVLIAGGGMIYAASMSTGNTEISRRTQEAQIIMPVDIYIDACFAMATMRALQTLSLQGGMSYISQQSIANEGMPELHHLQQTGMELPFETTKNTIPNAKTWYWQQLPIGIVLLGGKSALRLYPRPWEYPYQFFPYPAYTSTPVFTCNCGHPTIPPLEIGNQTHPSIQNMTERFAEEQFKKCVGNWSALNSQAIFVTPIKSPHIELQIGEDDLNFVLNYQVNATVGTSTIRIERSQWVQQYRVRLRKLYAIANETANRDNTDISFNITSVRGDEYTVTAQRNREGTKDDLITISDEYSRILDKKYNLSFMRHNRYPALWHIRSTGLSELIYCDSTALRIDENIFTITNGCAQHQNPLVRSPAPVKLSASDPDEDKVTYELRSTTRRGKTHYVDLANEPVSHPFMFGGGGGGGQCSSKGGSGGGIVYLSAKNIKGSGTIKANGGQGQDGTWAIGRAYAAGGGAGGSIYLRAETLDITKEQIKAEGGLGGMDYYNKHNAPAGGHGRTQLEITQGGSTDPVDKETSEEYTQLEGQVNTYNRLTADSAEGTTEITTEGSFEPEEKVLIIQSQGTGAGTYDIRTIKGTRGNRFILDTGLSNTYYTSGPYDRAQVISIPSVHNAVIQETLIAQSWNGQTGGIIAIDATGTLIINGNIDATAKGYKGGIGSGTCKGLCRKGNVATAYTGESFHGPSIRSPYHQFGGGSGSSCYSLDGAGGGHETAGGGPPLGGIAYGRIDVEVRAHDGELNDYQNISLLVVGEPGTLPPKEEPPPITKTNTCATLATRGVYSLENDIISRGDCFTITYPDIILDCQGHSITGDGTGTGIMVNTKNVLIKECNITQFNIGIEVPAVKEFVLENTFLQTNRIGLNAEAGETGLFYNNHVCNNQADVSITGTMGEGVEFANNTCTACPRQMQTRTCSEELPAQE